MLLVAGGDVRLRSPPGNPIQAWMDLMDVLKALCPAWSGARPAFGGDYRL
ncbi:MAG: hypothetical protein JSS41_09555 [Proteobacteria bacterium]|nr:hypothetical protein [Pseudomonadota bacterium]